MSLGEKLSGDINPPVFFGSAVLIVAFVLFGIIAPGVAESIFNAVQGWITSTFGWFYVLAVGGFLVFVLVLALGSFGNIRLGPDDSRPEFTNLSWFAMLFSAGMGIGLMFYGVAEPVLHFNSPPVAEAGTEEAARDAMRLTMFHWGLHAWAIYAVVGMSLAYFGYRYQLPLTIRSSLYPIIGDRIYGPIGHVVDTFAVLGTMFGVATSLGLGVMQVNAGLNYLFGIPEATATQLILIAIITAFATLSVVSGLDKGIRRISELNLTLALFLVVFVVLVGPTAFILSALVQNIGLYVGDVASRTFNLFAYDPKEWLSSWTLFYWGWWIAWAPFVGMFIARVSRGRSIREFVMGVLFVPVGFTVIWMTAFGTTAINFQLEGVTDAVSQAVDENVALALFAFLEQFPLSTITSFIATLLVITFFVTSSDSGSLVIDTITSGGVNEPPVWQRIFWAITEGVVASVLLLAGGLTALQTGAITSALPFAVIMLFVCWGLISSLRQEHLRKRSMELPTAPIRTDVPWQTRLASIVSHPKENEVERFLQEVALPALEDVLVEVRKRGYNAETQANGREVSLTVFHGEEREFLYAIKARGYRAPTFAYMEPAGLRPRDESTNFYRAEVSLIEGGQNYDVMGYTKEQLIADVLAQYERHMHFLHMLR